MASTSKAKEKGVPLDTILSTVGWRSAATFEKFCSVPNCYSSVKKTDEQDSREAIVLSSQIGVSKKLWKVLAERQPTVETAVERIVSK